jgi:hypothetical protein
MNTSFQPADPSRFETALSRLDEENARDPNRELCGASSYPRELIYAQWLTDWVLKLCPQASEALRLAARSQHLCRWEIPRDSYPMTRPGYLQWRAELKRFHARKSGEVLRAAGYGGEIIERVQALNLKRDFPQDPETCILEDALCLVFLERQFGALAAKTSAEKMVNALQKAWKKMSPAGRAEALKLPYTPAQLALLKQALPEP